uniref:Uncharacterized protein n=1 Tax=Zea mays TaxID=4577 RepID=A0A804UHS4_MAIZE
MTFPYCCTPSLYFMHRANPLTIYADAYLRDSLVSSFSPAFICCMCAFAMRRCLVVTKAAGRHGGEGVDRGRDEGADGVAEAGPAPAVDHVLPPRGQVRAAAGGARQAPPHGRRVQDRRAPPQVLAVPPLAVPRAPPPPGTGGRHGGLVRGRHRRPPQDPAHAARARLLRRGAREAHGDGRGAEPGRGAGAALRRGELQPGGGEGAAGAGRRRREPHRGPRREDAAPRGRRDGVPRHGRRASRPPRRPQRAHRRGRDAAGHPPHAHLRPPLQGRRAGARAHRAQQAPALPRARAVGGHGHVPRGRAHGGQRRAHVRRAFRRRRLRRVQCERHQQHELGEPEPGQQDGVPEPRDGRAVRQDGRRR